MKIPIFMIFQFFGVISAWAAKALEDGKISAAEAFELVTALAGILGVRLDFDVSDYMPTAVGVVPNIIKKVDEADIFTKPAFKTPDERPKIV